MDENRSTRNERAVVLATETSCEIFDRMFGLPDFNQDQKQDVTGAVAATAAMAGSAAGSVTAGTILAVNADEYGNKGPVEACTNSPLESKGLSDDVGNADAGVIVHLEISDHNDSFDEKKTRKESPKSLTAAVHRL
ncbi:unnamed protein product [Allacma fusca]|uniref:Uncharacterized protein n=1 Tax=Allacma fusca TaxID=39272 RepID=A0A8J2PM90_9HEXA|nr:unnamed protein product [Allacma fusca]